jgi:hypothetical protein
MPSPALNRPVIRSDAEAVMLTNAALDALEALEPVIERESALLAEGDANAAIALGKEKEGLARAYIQAIEAVKSNAIALRRLRPDAIDLLKERHDSFAGILAHNLQVLTTARSVSESIIREVSVDVARASKLPSYGPGSTQKRGGMRPVAGAPLAVAKDA